MGLAQRWQASIKATKLFIGRGGVNYQPEVAAVGTTMGPGGLSIIASASAAEVFTLAAPQPGLEKTLAFQSISSGAFVKLASGTFDGTNPVIKSTVAQLVRLMGLSTSRYSLQIGSSVGVNPSAAT